ncbi:MAG: hypothetical protein ABI643_03205 [Candidatus Doudnabacteria bacterium]
MKNNFEGETMFPPGLKEMRTPSKQSPENKPGMFQKVRKGVRKRLNAMALAGFLTLSLGSESYADQVKFARPENQAAHFVLETEHGEEGLEEFKNRIKVEEPEFFEWSESIESSVKTGIDNMTAEIKNLDADKDRQEESDFQAVDSAAKIKNSNLSDSIKQNHKVLDDLASNKDFYKLQQTIKDNLDSILWSFIASDDSLAVRNYMRENLSAVNIDFKYHQDFEFGNFLAITEVQPEPAGNKLQSNILLSPKSFIDEDNKINLNLYINTFVHELFHGTHPPTRGKNPLTGLQQVLIEGVAQNTTFNTIQFLARENKTIKPAVGMNEYDQRVVIVAVTDAIIRSSTKPDILAQWNAGIINDQEFLSTFKNTLAKMSLDSRIADDLANLNLPNTEAYPATTKALENILAHLKMNGYALSPDFIKSILTSGRDLNHSQIRAVETHLNLNSLNRNVSRRIKNIKK